MKITKRQSQIIAGDILTLLVVTFIGQYMHQTHVLGLWRFLQNALPLLLAWFLLAPWIQAYDESIFTKFQQLWRPFLAMVLAGPWVVFFRDILVHGILEGGAGPLFAIIFGGSAAIGILLWRFIAIFLIKWMNKN